ncbi:DoxX family membrane protein [Patescibacteria group bacterium]|nr:MAG: DoxX family membrane protein [Patescibacteria group bacterium]
MLQRARLRRWGTAVATAAAFAFPVVARAHERWFVGGAVGETPAFFRSFGWHIPIAIVAALLVLVAARIVDGWLRRLQFGRGASVSLARTAPFVPLAVGLATAVVLAVSALGRTLLAPHLALPDTSSGTALVIAQLVIAALLVLGLFARVAAGGLIVLVVWSFALHGVPAVENLFFLGVGFFLFVWGRGRLALGAVFSRIVFAMDTAHMKPVALSVLRIVTGLALLWGGIDKLWHPELHLALIAAHAAWNPLVILRSTIWPALSENLYLFMIAAVEIVIACLLLTGWLLRPLAAFLALLFCVSAIFLPVSDLTGHLPYIAVFLGFVLIGKSVERSDRL